jgi:hypothetical protein
MIPPILIMIAPILFCDFTDWWQRYGFDFGWVDTDLNTRFAG